MRKLTHIIFVALISLTLLGCQIPIESTNSENAEETEENEVITITPGTPNTEEMFGTFSEDDIIACLEKVPSVASACAVTEDNDPNGKLNEKGGYIAAVYFASNYVDYRDMPGETLLEKGTDAGGCIELYATAEDAVGRDEYLATFDEGLLNSGFHKVVGTMVIRTSKKLEESQREQLECNIIEQLTDPNEILEEEENDFADMEVHFIDVGQGDATLIKADGHYMLIDAGNNDKGTAVQYYLDKQGVEKLDYLILTHTDADHIGGADVIVSKFAVDKVFLGDFEKDSRTYEKLLNALEYNRMTYSTPRVGTEYQLGRASFTIIAPNATYSDADNSSIALILKNGTNSFLFTGDCGAEAEADILKNQISIGCDVYKVGHHGSKSSSSRAFLEAMTPTYSVISCEEGNAYGHPHAEVLNNLRALSVKVFRTDEQGSVVAYSDGGEITWNCSPSESWQAGESTQSDVSQEESSEGDSSEKQTDTKKGVYAVNGKNGKIHKVGECTATGDGDQAMTQPVYFDTYEEAEAYSISIAPKLEKRQCGNCW